MIELPEFLLKSQNVMCLQRNGGRTFSKPDCAFRFWLLSNFDLS
jgi:hypothetical protein